MGRKATVAVGESLCNNLASEQTIVSPIPTVAHLPCLLKKTTLSLATPSLF